MPAETKKQEKNNKKIVSKKKDYIYALGRRRTANCRVRIFLNHADKGKLTVNGLAIEQYFPGEINQKRYLEPLRTCNAIGKYFISAKASGSGKIGQLQAFIHGLSRALVLLDENFKPVLKKHGFLTRDPRMRERRKIGMGGKARRRKQSPKR